ncbi:MAG TPA: FAD binding domain-containing protein [Anaerolineales bacterium]|jgi:CO/xanthine dehydrogenase FAD-binding subunit
MISAYHRPGSLDEAIQLLARRAPVTYPLGGGTVLTQPRPDSVEVVDLQALGLNRIETRGNELVIGATATLQAIMESSATSAELKEPLRREAPLNIRNMATAAGTIVACDGRSPFVSALLALDAKMEQSIFDHSSGETRLTNLGEYLPLRTKSLIIKLILPLQVKFAYAAVARTPADKPIVSAALAQWPSGRTRLVIGGFGNSPSLAMDGTEADGLETAARNACHEATDDWGSAEYRMDIAARLTARCAQSIGALR